MKLNQMFSVLLCLLLFIGCNNSSKQTSQKNFKNYFFQPEWFSDTRVYEYELESENGKSFVYREFERVAENKLKNTIYDHSLNKYAIVIYEYHHDRVLVSDMYTIENWNKGKVTKETLKDSVVFEYQKTNNTFGFSNSSRMEGISNVNEFVSLKLMKEDQIEFHDQIVNVVVVNGQRGMDIKKCKDFPNDLTIRSDEEIYYAENIGVVYQESIGRNNKAKSRLKRIISSKVFEEMKNAR